MAILLFVPAAFADSLGTSSSTVTTNSPDAFDLLPGTLLGSTTVGIDGSVSYGDGPVGWTLSTDLASATTPLTFDATGAVDMNGATANFNLNDSLGGLLTGSLVWTQLVADPTLSGDTDLIGTIASLDVAPFSPTPNPFTAYFADLTDNGPATVTVVLNCGGVSCTSTTIDPVATIVSVSIAGTPTATPEPSALLLLGLGLSALFLAGRRFAPKPAAAA